MFKSLSKKFLLIALLSCSVLTYACAQKQVSITDSLRLSRYLDSVSSFSIFSQKYQLYYDSALVICPGRAAWWQQKAMPLFKQKKYEIGMPFLDSAVKYDSRKYIDYRAFMKCIFQKSYRESIKDFEASKSIIGAGVVMDHTYDFYIGLCYLQLNKLDSAEYFLIKTTYQQEKAKGESWVHFLDWFYLGIVYYEKDDFPKAMEIFDRSLKTYKNFADAKYYKAVCLKKLHRDDEALLLMKEAALDFQQGYTFNEDNAVFETYPYQKYKLSYYMSAVQALEKKK